MRVLQAAILSMALLQTIPVLADADSQPSYPDTHAPIGVMGDHMHSAGEWMFSYRYMFMHMDGSRDGSDSLSPAEIATTEPNPHAGPATLRVVPLRMDMEMHMLGAMYAPHEDLTLMFMTSYQRKVMEHRTFAGGAGTAVRGHFTTVSEGVGDTSVSGLFRLRKAQHRDIHLNLGLSLPTGSITESDSVLTPMGTRPTLRLPYPMQLGSGTYDLIAGATYNGWEGRQRWGAQYLGRFRLGRNNEGYSLGDIHSASAWTSYRFTPLLSGALRLHARVQGQVDGMDDRVTAPVQTADPDNQGGRSLDLGLSLNLGPVANDARGLRFALEFLQPLHRDLNGPQLETDWSLALGMQKSY